MVRYLSLASVALSVVAVAQPTGSSIVERNKYVVARAYPVASLRRGEEGRVAFRIEVGRDGRINGCRVTASSGYAALDQATCDMVLQGATADPVSGAQGIERQGTREGLVEWVLPEGAKRLATPPPFDTNLSASGEPIICKRQPKRGSTYISEKVCLTRADWKRQIDYAQEETRRYQAGGACGNGGLC